MSTQVGRGSGLGSGLGWGAATYSVILVEEPGATRQAGEEQQRASQDRVHDGARDEDTAVSGRCERVRSEGGCGAREGADCDRDKDWSERRGAGRGGGDCSGRWRERVGGRVAVARAQGLEGGARQPRAAMGRAAEECRPRNRSGAIEGEARKCCAVLLRGARVRVLLRVRGKRHSESGGRNGGQPGSRRSERESRAHFAEDLAVLSSLRRAPLCVKANNYRSAQPLMHGPCI